MADVQPLEAIRYAPDVNLARVVCPPFDTIAPKEQRRLYGRSPHNAVRLELPKGGDPYKAAAKTLRQWLNKGTLVRDEGLAFYAYQQEFAHGGESYRRRLLFGRLRLEPWDSGAVLPHERTFRGPKEDRLKLLRSLRLNTSPIFLVYPDSQQRVAPLVARAAGVEPTVQFSDEDGSAHSLWRIDDPHVVATISRGLQSEKLYVADGHHRYETALAYSEERQAGDGRESFVLVVLAAADDPGLLVLPIHRLVDVDLPVENALELLDTLFEVESRPSLADLLRDMADRGRMVNSFGLVAADSPDFYLLTLLDPEAAEPYLPRERSPAWRRLDAAIATNVILRRTLGLNDVQLEDIRTVWYGEDAEIAVAEVRQGRARYAVLLITKSRQVAIGQSISDSGLKRPNV